MWNLEKWYRTGIEREEEEEEEDTSASVWCGVNVFVWIQTVSLWFLLLLHTCLTLTSPIP